MISAFIIVLYVHGADQLYFCQPLFNGCLGRDQIPLLNADPDQGHHDATIIPLMPGNLSATS
jgi:hypothetical protein